MVIVIKTMLLLFAYGSETRAPETVNMCFKAKPVAKAFNKLYAEK